MGGLAWFAHVQWVQRQRPMWREHDAKLASLWRHDLGEPEGDSVIELPGVIELPDLIELPDVIVLPEAAESIVRTR